MITVPERIDFAKIPQVVDIPHLLEVQLASYERFLQRSVPMDKREVIGLESVFHSVFPVVSARGEFTLEYLGYSIGEPKYSVDECQERDLTFSAPLKAHAPPRRARGTEDGEKRTRTSSSRGLPRRASPHHRQGDVHHQRRRARDREPAPPLAGRRSSTRRSTRTGSSSSRRASSRTAARGSSSASTSTTSCTCTSTASGSCRSRCC